MKTRTHIAGTSPGRRLRRRSVRGAAALVSGCLLLTAGCTSSGNGEGSTSTANPSPVTTAPASTAASTPAADTSSATSSAPASKDDIAGDWSGTFANTTTGAKGTFTVKFTRQGETITGNITINGTDGGAGNITGKLSGNKITFGTITGSTISFEGSFSGNSMSGTYKAGTDHGTWKATR